MTSEAHRLGLYNRLGEVLGADHAETMMDIFASLATKEDLLSLRADVHELGAEIRGFYKTILVTMVASMTALTGIFAALLAAFR